MRSLTSPWSDAVISRFVFLWPSHSGGEISAMLLSEFGVHISRSALTGKASRMGMAKRENSFTPTLVPALKPIRKPTGPAPEFKSKRSLPPLQFKPRVAKIKPKHIALLDLTDTTCKYPYGEEAPFTFCGHPVRHGSYCLHHSALCLVAPAVKASSDKRAAA